MLLIFVLFFRVHSTYTFIFYIVWAIKAINGDAMKTNSVDVGISIAINRVQFCLFTNFLFSRMWAPSNEESYFDNMDNKKNVVHIMPTVEMLVTFTADRDLMRAKKACLLYAEKVDFKELIVSNFCSKRSLIVNIHYTCTCSNCVWPRNATSGACI